MNQLQFHDGTVIDCIGVHASALIYQGLSRQMYTFLFPPDADLGLLSSLFTPENCQTIGIIQDNSVFYHENFTIRYGMGVSSKALALESPLSASDVSSLGTENDPQTEFFAWVKMIETTAAERQLAEQQEVIDQLLIAELERSVEEPSV